MNQIALKQAIKASGYRMDFIAKTLGLSYQGFYNKVNSETEFRISEIKALCSLLKLDTEKMYSIFFD